MDKLVQLYKQIISTANIVADDAGLMSITYAGETRPVLVKGKRLALPTSEALKSNKDKIMIFHPLYENIMVNTETEVVSKFRKLLNARFDYTVGILFVKLIDLTISTAEHTKLSPDQSEVLSILKNASEKTFAVVKKLISESDGLVNIYCKRSGKVENNPYRQASIVTFPLYKELLEKKDKYFNVAVSNKDREVLLKLYRYVFPNIDTPEYYNKGSNSKIAPCMEALMKSVITLGQEINDRSSMYIDLFINPEDVIINGDWAPTFDDLDALVPLIRSVPMQGSNMVAAEPASPSNSVPVPASVKATLNASMPTPNAIVEQKPEVKPGEYVSSNGTRVRGNLFGNNNAVAPVVQAPVVAPVYQPPMLPVQQPQVNSGGAVSLTQLYGNAQPQMNQMMYHGQMQAPRATFGGNNGMVYPQQQQQAYNQGYVQSTSSLV